MRQFSMILAGCLSVALVGCSGNPMSMATSAGTTAFKAVRGAQAEATPIRVQSAALLSSYKSIQLGQITTDVPPICTPEVMRKVREGVREGMALEDVRKTFPGGEKALRLEIACRFYKSKSMIGGTGRLDWLVTLADAQSEDCVAVIFVEGVSESELKHGAADMAKENTKGLMKFVRKYTKK